MILLGKHINKWHVSTEQSTYQIIAFIDINFKKREYNKKDQNKPAHAWDFGLQILRWY